MAPRFCWLGWRRMLLPMIIMSLLLWLPLTVSAFVPLHHHHHHPQQQQQQQKHCSYSQPPQLPTFPVQQLPIIMIRLHAVFQPREPKIQSDLSIIPNASSLVASDEKRITKFRTLKDLMWVRETMEDLTAAQFACSIDSTTNPKKMKQQQQRRAIDYDQLLANLDRRILDMACEDVNECQISIDRPTLTPEKGMAAIVYTESQRNNLLSRILETRKALMEAIQSRAGVEVEVDESSSSSSFTIPLLELKIPKEEDDPSSLGPKLYVRDDGTVDWDGALQDRAALRNFGTAVWARINGQNPEFGSDEESMVEPNSNDHHHDSTTTTTTPKVVTVDIEETDAIRKEKATLDLRILELQDLEIKHTALLNSALTAGQAVANINLATLDPSTRSEIRESSSLLDKKREEVSYQRLRYELERVYTYLEGELGNPSSKGYIPLQDRLNVAEFGLLESQLEGFERLLQAGESVLDADVLAVVSDQMTDFKRRLGIDYYVTGVTFDQEAIRRWLQDLFQQIKRGVAFYVKGCELFWNDIVYALTLIGRALQGYTLKPREVRNLRRTFKDIVTFIPVVIILIIPLTPVGHVMVFGAIQRFFPDFFPSCFTERRQNLLSLYESTEYTQVKIDESWTERLARISGAIRFMVSRVYLKLAGAFNDSEGFNGEADANGEKKKAEK